MMCCEKVKKQKLVYNAKMEGYAEYISKLA